MRVLLAAGGTGGHVIPALVVARELLARNPASRVLFVGTAKGVENRLVAEAGFPLALVDVGALQGQPLVVRLRNFFRLPRAVWQASRILREFQPHVVLGVGGYAAGPVMLAAALAGIPLAVLEPNAFPGMANRWIAPYVARAFLAFPEAASFFVPAAPLITGMPVRREFFEIRRQAHGRPLESPFTVLVFGGSQGARTLNRAVVEALPKLAQCGKNLRIVHQTGQSEYNSVREAYVKYPLQAEVLPYIEGMPEAFARADLVVCRAGASTVAELAAAGKAAVLVPFPSSANQHQLRNAEAVARSGAALLILDRELNGETLFSAVRDMCDGPERIERMEARIRALARPEAAGRIAGELERLGRLGSAAGRA
jgi:UDP-N-acetylglucosamine--N-acetylmuramyl-(pentapeptide) pyrophosphoryl-undecaprenol N-acetylglucosamine transferase